MTNAFGRAIVLPNVAAPSGNGAIRTDPVDVAIDNLGESNIVTYLRAKTLLTPGSSITDRLNNSVTVADTNMTYNASDANFNGQPTVSTSSCTQNPMRTATLGLNGSFGAMPASFTVCAVLRRSSSHTDYVLSQVATAQKFITYFNPGGNFNWDTNFGGTDSSGSTGATVALAINTSAVIWFSWDNTAMIMRYGAGSASALYTSSAGSNAFLPQTGAALSILGGKDNPGSGQQFEGTFAMYAILNGAYMNGAVPANDALFTNLIAACKAKWNV
jgi:hypothetical protein